MLLFIHTYDIYNIKHYVQNPLLTTDPLMILPEQNKIDKKKKM